VSPKRRAREQGEVGFKTASPQSLGTHVRAAKVTWPAAPTVGQALEIPLAQYWRGNVPATDAGLVHDADLFPHVPNLVEYALTFPRHGTFAIEVRLGPGGAGYATVTLDGEPVGILDAATAGPRDDWRRIGVVPARAGDHRLRFTSPHVETAFPPVTALRLVYQSDEPPPERPEPAVVAPRPALPPDWYKTITRKIHADFHTGGFIRGVGKDFDPDAYAARLAASHVNAICVFAKCHHGYAYYNTKVGTRHPGLDFDLMAAQIDACHKCGIAVWVYFSVEFDELYATTQQDRDARPNIHTHKLLIDPAWPYVSDYTWPMVTECVRDYDIDGFFFDFPASEAFVTQTVRLIKSIKPGVVVAYNHQWTKTRAELADLDILEIESWRHKQTLYHWPYVARYARGAVPMTAMAIRFWKSWGDFGGIADEAMMRYDAATGLANGCALTIGDHPHPHGRLDPALYKRIGRVFADAEAVEPYVTDARSVPYVAVLRQGEDKCHAVLDAGLHFNVVHTTHPLDDYAAVIVPDGAAVDADYTAALDRYVRRGGRLLVAGAPTEPLAALCGVRVRGDAEPSYVRINSATLPTPPATDLYTYEDVAVVDRLDGTREVAALVWPMNHDTVYESRRQSPPSEEPSGHPAIAWRDHGSGRVAYCAVPIFDVYAQWGYTPMRQILADLLRAMIPPAARVADVDAPVPLEVSVTRKDATLVLHLVHCPQSRRTTSSFRGGDLMNREPMIDGVPTVCRVRVRLPQRLVPGGRFRMLRPEAHLKVSREPEGTVTLNLPPFEIHAIVLHEPDAT
jgi:hypothetical protein